MRDQNLYTAALCGWLTNRSAQVDSCFASPGWNWEQFARAATNSAVLPALNQNYLDPAAISKLPQEIAAVTSLTNTLNAERNRTVLAQVQQLVAEMNRFGIQPIALKGLANILMGVYPDLGSRYLADIDLLVRPDKCPTAVSVLQKLGYTTHPAPRIEFVIGHTYPFLTRPNSIEVDLHRTLGLGACALFLPAAEVIRDSTLCNLNGVSVRVPSPEHLVIHHIMHSQMHDGYRERINPSVRTLYDFFLLQRHFRGSLDWQSIEDRFRCNGQYATLALYLMQAEQSLGLQPPIALKISPQLRFRSRRRQLLQQAPVLRFFDPFYYFLAGLRPRTRRLREILAQPGGLRYLLRKFYEPKFYARLRHDLG